MKLLAVSIGQPQTVRWQNKDVLTSIYKNPVPGPHMVKKENIVGDRQADLRVHGGVDKAVYAYSHDTYPWWQKKLNLPSLPFGALGENLTFETLDETQIFVGDVFEMGGCEIEAVQPRLPCFKLGIMYGDQKIIQTFNDFHRSGIYFRVKKEGVIQAGDTLKLVSSEKVRASISELFQFVKDKNITSKARATEVLQIQSLNVKWREKYAKIAQGLPRP